MRFEFDPAKSALNTEKHGMDFVEAQLLWADPALLVVPARNMDEPRFLAIGKIGARHWSAIYTMRDGAVRIISVRRARREEIEHYESD